MTFAFFLGVSVGFFTAALIVSWIHRGDSAWFCGRLDFWAHQIKALERQVDALREKVNKMKREKDRADWCPNPASWRFLDLLKEPLFKGLSHPSLQAQ